MSKVYCVRTCQKATLESIPSESADAFSKNDFQIVRLTILQHSIEFYTR